MKRVASLCGVIVVAGIVAAAQAPKYGVTVKADGKTDFSKLKTYTWEHGWQAFDKRVDQQVTASVDRELAGVGLAKRDARPADVLVTYASLRRIDVDLDSKPVGEDGTRRQYDVGTLVVLLLEPETRKELFRARVDQPIEAADVSKVTAAVDAAIKEMFAKYPTRAKK